MLITLTAMRNAINVVDLVFLCRTILSPVGNILEWQGWDHRKVTYVTRASSEANFSGVGQAAERRHAPSPPLRGGDPYFRLQITD